MSVAYILYFLTGAIAGLLAGMFGIGGGSVVVPGLAFVFADFNIAPHAIMHMAAGTSLAAMIVMAVTSTISHHRRGAVLWNVFFLMLPGMLVGTVFGAYIAAQLSTKVLKIIFGIFLIYISIRMFSSMAPIKEKELPGKIATAIAGVVVGVCSGLLGIGGGAITIPLLLRCHVSIREASGTSAACGLPIAIIGTISFIILGWNVSGLPPYSTGYVFWPAAIAVTLAGIFFVPIGGKLSQRLPVAMLRKILAVILMIIAIDLIIF